MLGQERSGPRNAHCGSSSLASCSWRRSALTGGADGTCPWFDNHLYLACSVLPKSFFNMRQKLRFWKLLLCRYMLMESVLTRGC
jgi:hypothetical protein